MARLKRSNDGAPKSKRGTWVDLAAVAVLSVLACGVVLTGGGQPTLTRVAFGLPLLVFLPGYAFVASLFPAQRTESERSTADDPGHALAGTPATIRYEGVDPLERVALSVGMSVAIVPLTGLVLDQIGLGISLVPVVVAVGSVTLLATGIAAVRRARVPSENRFGVPYHDWIAAVRAETVDSRSRADAVLSVLVVLGVLVAMSSIVYAVSVPDRGSQPTELALTTENESGELVAEGYPETIDGTGNETLHVGVTNGDRGPAEYTLVVQIERVEATNDSGLRVLEREQLQQHEISLDRGESWKLQHTPTPEMRGEQLRLSYLLYEGDPPAPDERTPDDAYRSASLRVTVN